MSIDSLLSNLKNKVTYTLHQAVTDPNANEFASSQQESPSSAIIEKVEDDSDYFKLPSTDDPNTFDINRMIIKTGNMIIRMIKKGFYPFIALILSMYVTNEMIMYSAPIRLIFFIVTFLICYNFMPFLIILVGYYLCKSGYEYYLNQLSDGPKTKIMPTIFALLPLTTDIPDSSLGGFFMYPFTYPKNNKDAKQLPIIMNNYMESLKKSFTYFDKIKNLPFVAEGFQRLESNIEHLHDVPKKPEPAATTAPEPASMSSSSSSTSLPATIESPTKQSSEPVRNNTATPLPATIEKFQNQSETPSNNNKKNGLSATPLPATIEKSQNQSETPSNNKKNGLSVTPLSSNEVKPSKNQSVPPPK